MLPVLRKVTKFLSFDVQNDKKLWKQKKFNKFKKTWEHQQYFVQRGQESVPHRRRSPDVPNHPKMAPMVIFVSPKPFLVFATLSLYIVFLFSICSKSTSSAMASAMTSWKLLVPLTANTRFLVLWCKKTANLKKTDENRHHFSFQTKTWENRRLWDLPQHRPWLGLLQRHQGSYRALHSPGWMMMHFFAELVKGGGGPNKSETLPWPKILSSKKQQHYF